MIWNFVYVVFVFICVFLIITVLLQPGKAGGLGAAFGGGGNTVFGASGGTPVFRRLTTGAAVCFMLLSLLLAWAAVDTSSEAKEKKKVQGLDFNTSQQLDLLEIPTNQPAAAPIVAPNAAAPAPTPNTVPAIPTLPTPTVPNLGNNLAGSDAPLGLGGSDLGVPNLAMPSLNNVEAVPAVDAPAVAAPAVEAPAVAAPAVDAPAVAAPAVDATAAAAPAVDAPAEAETAPAAEVPAA